MNRIMIAVVLVAASGWAPLHAQDKPLKDQFQAILKEYTAAQQPLLREYQAAKTDAEKEAIKRRLPALAKPFAEKAIKLADENSKDPFAAECLRFALEAAQHEKAGERLLQLQPEPKLLIQTCMNLMYASMYEKHASAERFLKLAVTAAKEKEVQGFACWALARIHFAKSDSVGDERTFAALLKSAEEYAVKLSQDYADVMGPRRLKMGVEAERLLFQIRNLHIGSTAPEVVSKDMDDKEAKLSALRGKVVVLDIWFTGCVPCVQMIPHEREIVEKLKDKPFAFVSISVDDDKKTLAEFLSKTEMPWTHWWEGVRDKGIIVDWNVDSYPTVYVLDAKGVIRYKNIRGKQLEDALEKLLKEAEKKS